MDVREERLILPLLASSLIHVVVIAAASLSFNAQPRFTERDLLRVTVIDFVRPSEEKSTVTEKQTAPAATPARSDAAPQKLRPREPIPNKSAVEPKRPALAAPEPPAVEEPSKPSKRSELPEPSTLPPPSAAPSFISPSLPGSGASDGPGSLSSDSAAGTRPGPGISPGGGFGATSGSRHGSGPAGLDGQPGPIRTNRQARPIETARASYPPMALRMGLEGDVVLKIEVDAEGKVTRAEVVKSAGAGFDDEALKAVKDSRFEPAEQDGKKVAAAFTYIYRFRLRK